MSDRVLFDTCVLSYLLKQDTRSVLFVKRLEGYTGVISFMTLGELYRWPNQRNWGKQKMDEFHERIGKYVVLPYTKRICWYWAQLMDLPGRPMPASDAWIASTALAFDIPLATHNIKHFQHISGLTLL